MKEKTQLAAIVSEERKKLGYTQEEFALRVGVSLSFLRKLEQGKKALKLDKADEVLSFLGYRLEAVKGRDWS